MDRGILAADRLAVNLDELQYDLVTYNQFAKLVGNCVLSDSYNGKCVIVMDEHSLIRFKIRGASKVYGIFTLHGWSGIMKLKANGATIANIDLYSQEPQKALLCLFDGTTNGDVEIVLQPVGKNEKSNSGQIVFHGILLDHEERNSILLLKENEVTEPEIDLDVTKEVERQKITDDLSLVDGIVGMFIVLNNDKAVSQSIYTTGCWGKEELSTFKRCIRRGDTVFDIGSNIGHHSVFFSKTVGNKGRVYCFEPQNLIFKTLCANLLLVAYPLDST